MLKVIIYKINILHFDFYGNTTGNAKNEIFEMQNKKTKKTIAQCLNYRHQNIRWLLKYVGLCPLNRRKDIHSQTSLAHVGVTPYFIFFFYPLQGKPFPSAPKIIPFHQQLCWEIFFWHWDTAASLKGQTKCLTCLVSWILAREYSTRVG